MTDQERNRANAIYDYLNNMKKGQKAKIINDFQKKIVIEYMTEMPNSGNLHFTLGDMSEVRKFLFFDEDYKSLINI